MSQFNDSDGPNDVRLEKVKTENGFHPSIIESNSLAHSTENETEDIKIKIEYGAIDLPFADVKMPTITDEECVSPYRIELKPPINDESEKENRIPSNNIDDLVSECKVTPTLEWQPDTTTVYDVDDDDYDDDVEVISSESDVTDILELFHCYFCDETFRSLDALSVHIKTCSFSPSE